MRNAKTPRTRTRRPTDPKPARKNYASAPHGVTRRGPRGGGALAELDQVDDQVAELDQAGAAGGDLPTVAPGDRFTEDD